MMKRRLIFVLAAMLCTSVSLVCADDPEELVVGKPAPDFTATGIDGKKFKLYDKLRDQDKNIVLLFSRAHW